MIVVEIVRAWGERGVRVELTGIPRLGDVVVVDMDLDGTVQEVVWEPGEPVKVRLG